MEEAAARDFLPTKADGSQTDRIRRLNDEFRRQGGGAGKFVMIAGVASQPLADQAAILRKVMSYDAFTPDNDPYGARDFGALEHEGQKIFWKIDYYAPDMAFGSEDPAGSPQTARVLTVMFADEY